MNHSSNNNNNNIKRNSRNDLYSSDGQDSDDEMRQIKTQRRTLKNNIMKLILKGEYDSRYLTATNNPNKNQYIQ
jgi:hypothetical protein